MSRIYLAYRSKKQRFCAVQAFCAAKPWRRANSLRPSILISCRNPKKEVTTYVVTSFFGAGDEARSRHCRAATRTAGDKRPTGAFLPAGPAAGPSCSRHPMVHQIEPSLKDCNKKRAAISCNAYFGAPSVGALRIQSGPLVGL